MIYYYILWPHVQAHTAYENVNTWHHWLLQYATLCAMHAEHADLYYFNSYIHKNIIVCVINCYILKLVFDWVKLPYSVYYDPVILLPFSK